MTTKKRKEQFKKMCECGHEKGEHTYINPTMCFGEPNCPCKEFRLKIKKIKRENKHG